MTVWVYVATVRRTVSTVWTVFSDQLDRSPFLNADTVIPVPDNEDVVDRRWRTTTSSINQPTVCPRIFLHLRCTSVLDELEKFFPPKPLVRRKVEQISPANEFSHCLSTFLHFYSSVSQNTTVLSLRWVLVRTTLPSIPRSGLWLISFVSTFRWV